MKNLYFIFIVAFSVLMLLPDETEAQRRNNYSGSATTYKGPKRKFQYKYLSVGLSANVLNYFGDLAPKSGAMSTNISMTRPGIGLVTAYRLDPRISVRGTFTYGRVMADDNGKGMTETDKSIYRNTRNLSFRNDIKELAIVGAFDIIKHNRSYLTRELLVPYAFAGVAVFHHNPQGKVPESYGGPEAGQWVDLEPLGTEGQYVEDAGVSTYSKIQIAIPVGLGVRYKVNQNFDLALEIGYRHLFFDHLDDVGGTYIDKNRFGDNELAKVMSDRSGEFIEPTVMYNSLYGDPYLIVPGYGHENANGSPNIRGNHKDKDIYVVTSLQLTYILDTTRHRRSKFR